MKTVTTHTDILDLLGDCTALFKGINDMAECQEKVNRINTVATTLKVIGEFLQTEQEMKASETSYIL